MKAAGIVKIVIGSVLLLVLVTILCGVFLGRAVWREFDVGERLRNNRHISEIADRVAEEWDISEIPAVPNIPDMPGVPDKSGSEMGTPVAIGSTRISAADIRKIDVEWIAGYVNVVVGASDEIVITESSNKELTDVQKMRVFVSEGRVKVEYCDNFRNVWDWFVKDSFNIPSKSLRVEIPASLIDTLTELDIEAVSADVDVDGVYGQNMDVETVSGDIIIENAEPRELSVNTASGAITVKSPNISDLDLETVSGNVKLDGMFTKIDVDGVSGKVEIVCGVTPYEIDVDTVSGNVKVWLPKDANFTASLEIVSGKISSEIPGTMSSHRLVAGDGMCPYKFNSVSGNVGIYINTAA